VNHPDDRIETVAEDRQAAVARVGERADELVETDARRDRDDVAAGDADVPGSAFAKMQQVAKHLALSGAQVAGDRTRILSLVDRIFNFVAQRGLAVIAENQGAHPPPQARAASVVPVPR